MPGDWPEQVGDHRVTTEWECAGRGASDGCLIRTVVTIYR